MLFAGIFALLLQNALQAFQILLQIGAGTGLIFILRWFWWRINAYSEISAMIISFLVAIYFELIHPALGFTPLGSGTQLVTGVGITTLVWVVVTFLTPATDDATLIKFYKLVHPGGPGWKRILAKTDDSELNQASWDVPQGILAMLLGTIAIYSALFATGAWIYSDYTNAIILTSTSTIAIGLLLKLWNKLHIE